MSVDRKLLESFLNDPGCAWSLGTFGAIGEFARDPDEPVEFPDGDGALGACTARGAIRVDAARVPRIVAYETPSSTAGRWSHGVVFCLPADEARGPARRGIADLGPDTAAIRGEDRDARLFDVGVGAPHIDFCIRTRDAALISLLRKHEGGSVFAPGSPVGAAMLAAQPHRITVSRLGRIEVFQPIAAPDGRTPSGPHTHLLPKLLASGQTHARTTPIPEGFQSCLEAYPASPINDAEGRPTPFDAMRHVAFEVVLREHGIGEYVGEKERFRAAFVGGADPERYEPPQSRLGRAAVRVALRQMACLGSDEAVVARWASIYDRNHEQPAADH